MCNHDNTHVQQCTFRDALNLMSKKSNWFEWQSSDYTCNVYCICVYSIMTKLLSQNVDLWKFRSDKLVHVHTCIWKYLSHVHVLLQLVSPVLLSSALVPFFLLLGFLVLFSLTVLTHSSVVSNIKWHNYNIKRKQLMTSSM